MNFIEPVKTQQRYPGFAFHALDENHGLFIGSLPRELLLSASDFDRLWNAHPADFHDIMIHGRLVKTPRWQQAYGKDYHYTGNVNRALAVPPLLEPILSWSEATFDKRLNGLLVNWYDGRLEHYIGAHRDSTKYMLNGAPIVTISLGEQRVFRLRPWKGKGKRDFEVRNGTVMVMPYATNEAWTHEVPKSKRLVDRRISITIRAFE